MPTPFNQNQSSRQKIPNCKNVGDLRWFAHMLDLQLEVTSVPPFKSELGCSLAFSFLPLGFVILSFPNSKSNCVRLGDGIRELGFVEFMREQLVDFWATWIVNECLSCGHFSGNSNEFTNLVALQEILSRPIQFLSAGVTTDPFNALGLGIEPTRREQVLKAKKAGEDSLRRSGLGYTIIRPGPLQGISCADVADICVKALHDSTARNRSFDVCYEYVAEPGKELYELVRHINLWPFNAGIILTESNYDIWSQLMEMHIAGREKLSYIHGRTKPPAESEAGYEKWVHIFLTGLDGEFEQIHGEVLRKEPVPDLDECYALVRREAVRRATLNGESENLETSIMLACNRPRYPEWWDHDRDSRKRSSGRNSTTALAEGKANGDDEVPERVAPLLYDTLTSAAYLINRVPSSTVKFQTSFQALQYATNAPTIPNLQPHVFRYGDNSHSPENGLDTSYDESSHDIEAELLSESFSLQPDTPNQSLVEDALELVPNSPKRHNPPHSTRGVVYAPLKKRPGVVVVGLNGGSHGDDKNTTIIEGGGGGRIGPCWWCFTRNAASSSSRNGWARIGLVTAAAAAIMFSSVGITNARTQQQPKTVQETLSDIPQMLSGECSAASAQDCKKARIQRPKSRKAESCTIKCVTTCIRGGSDGSPGEGPLNLRRMEEDDEEGSEAKVQFWIGHLSTPFQGQRWKLFIILLQDTAERGLKFEMVFSIVRLFPYKNW
ncbi:hypothetical protein RHSIM_Rhsim08G0252300 [Rhododendron simsii]|uniref:Retrotransposon Copia-like N-terminal domain-containing protein n=1 Tax=Rhododendron simsii TaxID=118357 RepID=A0A834GNE2_RHOSS|nr:hypothetical protein RHSIM_Rhsim08G0252300 [Rhododendron simsii]